VGFQSYGARSVSGTKKKKKKEKEKEKEKEKKKMRAGKILLEATEVIGQ
jgi:hypothetical protein